jgi:hypothetical protein
MSSCSSVHPTEVFLRQAMKNPGLLITPVTEREMERDLAVVKVIVTLG